MNTLTTSVTIDAPMEYCRLLAKDLGLLYSYLQLSSPQQTVALAPAPAELRIGHSPMARGVEYRFTTNSGPLKSGFQVKLVEERPPYELVLSGTQPMQSSYRLHYRFSESGTATEMKLTMELEFSKSVMARVLSPLAVILQRASLQVWTKIFKEAAERAAALSDMPEQTSSRARASARRQERWPKREEREHVEQFQPPPGANDEFEGISGAAVALFFVGLLMLAATYLSLFGFN